MNVIKDVSFEGRILQVTEKALEFVRSQIKERTYLGADARFVTESEYPEFAWKELIVNAVAHRLCKALHNSLTEGKVIQSRGLCNTNTPHHDRIVQLVNAHAHQILAAKQTA